MPSDYKEICKDNIRRRGEEFDDIGRLISEQLYSDRTHFIYELLQNAEDAMDRRKRNNPESELPTNVRFLLYKDRLEFRHFGEKFNSEDVKGVSDVLKGTKTDDRSQIGKFGIGFKSVYAFTSTPEIHSGDEHFVIERYIRPRSADRIIQLTNGETVFIFPFNHENLSKERSFQLIEEKLRNLGSRILLFLKNISEIEWKIEDQSKGQNLKDPKQIKNGCKKIFVIGRQGIEDKEEEWLVFERNVETNNSFSEVVEIAFKLEEDQTKKQRIISVGYSPLIVYFPTKLETRFGFLIQGPYDTTASRSDIEDNDWNEKLIEETAVLLTERVLPTLKEMDLLTVSLLEALPIRIDDFPTDSIFRPIYDRIRNALCNHDLIPTAQNNIFTSGKYAVLARGEDLVQLLNPEQLSIIMDAPHILEWVTTEITENRKDIYRYLLGWKPNHWESGEEIQRLIFAEVRPEDIIRKSTPEFLKDQSTSWILQFYKFYKNRKALWDKLKYAPIIRLQDGTHVSPCSEDDSPNAFLPPEGETEFPVVCSEIVQDEVVLEFLKELGLTEPDTVDEVIRLLIKYTNDFSNISIEEHMRDCIKIERAFKTDSQEKMQRLKWELKKTSIVLVDYTNEENPVYRKTTETYTKNDELQKYFADNDSINFISSEYSENMITLLKEIGVSDKIRISCKSKLESFDDVDLGYSYGYKRGLKGFDPTIKVEGLENALSCISAEKSRIIWNKIASAYRHCIKGMVLTSSRRDFSPDASTYKEDEKVSDFGRMLTETQWLLDSNGNFHKPTDLSLDDLPDSFIHDEKLARQLDMKQDINAKLAEQAGIAIEDLEQFKQFVCGFEQWKEEKHIPAFPESPSSNPERRQEKLTEHLEDAPNREYEPRERSVRTTRGTIDPDTQLRNIYTNNAGQMICQICKKEMPFKKRDGEYYFERVEALSKDHFTKEHEAQFLALCPLCAAKYKEFIKRNPEEMVDLKTELKESVVPDIPLRPQELDTSIRFVETHYCDIKTILETSTEDES